MYMPVLTESAQCTFSPCDTMFVSGTFVCQGQDKHAHYEEPITASRIVTKMGVLACNVVALTPDGYMEETTMLTS